MSSIEENHDKKLDESIKTFQTVAADVARFEEPFATEGLRMGHGKTQQINSGSSYTWWHENPLLGHVRHNMAVRILSRGLMLLTV
jgi:hypothetical protein